MSPLTNADGPDLLDFLAEVEQGTAIPDVHCIMPNMSLACGEDLLTVLRRGRSIDRHRRATTTTSETTCPDCLAVGDLPAQSRAMSRPRAGSI